MAVGVDKPLTVMRQVSLLAAGCIRRMLVMYMRRAMLGLPQGLRKRQQEAKLLVVL
jgi:hypothetical protein